MKTIALAFLLVALCCAQDIGHLKSNDLPVQILDGLKNAIRVTDPVAGGESTTAATISEGLTTDTNLVTNADKIGKMVELKKDRELLIDAKDIPNMLKNDADLSIAVKLATDAFLKKKTRNDLGNLDSVRVQILYGNIYELIFRSSLTSTVIFVYRQPSTNINSVTSIVYASLTSSTAKWTDMNDMNEDVLDLLKKDSELSIAVKFAIGAFLKKKSLEYLGNLDSMRKQLVDGINYELTFKSRNTQTVIIVVYRQPSTNTTSVTSIVSASLNNRTDERWIPISYNKFEAMDKFREYDDADTVYRFVYDAYFSSKSTEELGELKRTRTQLAARTNYELTFKSSKSQTVILVYRQPSTNTTSVTSIFSSFLNRHTGRWTSIDINKKENKDGLKNDANFLIAVKQAITAYSKQSGEELGELVWIRTQLVDGTNYELTFRSSKNLTVIVVYRQPWTNTTSVTSIVSTSLTSSSDRWTAIAINKDRLKQNDLSIAVKLATDTFKKQSDEYLGKLESIRTQLVDGTNYELTFRSDKNLIVIVVYQQPWTNTTSVTSIVSNSLTSSSYQWITIDKKDIPDKLQNDDEFSIALEFAINSSYKKKNREYLGELVTISTYLQDGTIYNMQFQSYQSFAIIKVYRQPWTNTTELLSITKS